MVYPKLKDSKGIEHEALCFGNFSEFPCARLGNQGPCPFAEICKNATPISKRDSQCKGFKYTVKPNGSIKAEKVETT